jgi:hypothetical protein
MLSTTLDVRARIRRCLRRSLRCHIKLCQIPLLSPLQLTLSHIVFTMKGMMFLLFLFMYEEEQKKKEKNNQRTRGGGWYKAALSAEGKRRRNQRIPCASLLMPWVLHWEKVNRSANDQSLITLTGFDCASFNTLHARFRFFLKLVYSSHE